MQMARTVAAHFFVLFARVSFRCEATKSAPHFALVFEMLICILFLRHIIITAIIVCVVYVDAEPNVVRLFVSLSFCFSADEEPGHKLHTQRFMLLVLFFEHIIYIFDFTTEWLTFFFLLSYFTLRGLTVRTH